MAWLHRSLLGRSNALALHRDCWQDMANHWRDSQHRQARPCRHERGPMFGTSTNRVELDHTSRELLAVLVEEGGLQVLEGASILNLCVPATIGQDHHGREGLLGADIGRRLRLRLDDDAIRARHAPLLLQSVLDDLPRGLPPRVWSRGWSFTPVQPDVGCWREGSNSHLARQGHAEIVDFEPMKRLSRIYHLQHGDGAGLVDAEANRSTAHLEQQFSNCCRPCILCTLTLRLRCRSLSLQGVFGRRGSFRRCGCHCCMRCLRGT